MRMVPSAQSLRGKRLSLFLLPYTLAVCVVSAHQAGVGLMRKAQVPWGAGVTETWDERRFAVEVNLFAERDCCFPAL